MSELLRIIRLAIGAAPLLLCKVWLHNYQPWRPTIPASITPHLRTRCTRCLRWKDDD